MKKDFFALILAIVLVFVVALNIEIQSVDEFYNTQLEEVEQGSETVFLSVTGNDNLEIIVKSEYVLRTNDTVFSVLDRVLRYNRIVFDFRGVADVYVAGINGLSEFDFGATSGWIYSVNGVFPSIACNRFVLLDGDIVEFIYSKNGVSHDS